MRTEGKQLSHDLSNCPLIFSALRTFPCLPVWCWNVAAGHDTQVCCCSYFKNPTHSWVRWFDYNTAGRSWLRYYSIHPACLYKTSGVFVNPRKETDEPVRLKRPARCWAGVCSLFWDVHISLDSRSWTKWLFVKKEWKDFVLKAFGAVSLSLRWWCCHLHIMRGHEGWSTQRVSSACGTATATKTVQLLPSLIRVFVSAALILIDLRSDATWRKMRRSLNLKVSSNGAAAPWFVCHWHPDCF